MFSLSRVASFALAVGAAFSSLSAEPVAGPAAVDVVTFEFKLDNENHKVVVNSGSSVLRVDEPSDGYSVLYDPATEHFTGLEHRNYTWWQFSWPEVRAAVENSKRNAARLEDLSSQGLNSDSASSSTNAPASSASLDEDDSGYVWQATTERKQIDDIDCIRWTGSTQSGETIEAWCSATPMPKVQAAVERLRLIDEPMSLVAIRTVAPDFIFPVYHALAKGGATPLLIVWGDDSNRNSFRLVDERSRDLKPGLFVVPKLYTKTTLVSMDGLINQQPAPAPRKAEAPKTWQSP